MSFPSDDKAMHDLLIVGAGPAGLECALAACARGLDVLVLERGRVGENMRRWGFVQLFTPWSQNVSERGLQVTSAVVEDAAHSGQMLVERYLMPIAKSPELRDCVREGMTVRWMGRSGTEKSQMIGDPARAALPFLVLAEDAQGQERQFRARAVVDASGVSHRPRWLGDGGIPAQGERDCGAWISYHVTELEAQHCEGQRFAVLGAGYSAATMLEQFCRLRAAGVQCEVDWCVKTEAELPLRPIADDPLPARHRLATLAVRAALGNEASIRLHRGCGVERVEEQGGQVWLRRRDQTVLGPYDRIFAMVGYAPDLSLCEELQFHSCYATQGPMKLAAALLAQAGGDCLSLGDTNAETLRNPEPGFFVIGAKSYGRNPDFLLQRLPAQIEAVLAMIARPQ